MKEEDPIRFMPAPPFCQMLRASGGGETWRHLDDTMKMQQFGWKSTTSENAYKPDTLVGNWSEDRWDMQRMRKVKPLPSQHSHYYETMYDTYYNKIRETPPAALRNLVVPRPKVFPGHQSDLDHVNEKEMYNSWATTSRESYVNPEVRRVPLVQRPETHEYLETLHNRERHGATEMCPGPMGSEY